MEQTKRSDSKDPVKTVQGGAPSSIEIGGSASLEEAKDVAQQRIFQR